jgi:hypothetical protein
VSDDGALDNESGRVIVFFLTSHTITLYQSPQPDVLCLSRLSQSGSHFPLSNLHGCEVRSAGLDSSPDPNP